MSLNLTTVKPILNETTDYLWEIQKLYINDKEKAGKQEKHDIDLTKCKPQLKQIQASQPSKPQLRNIAFNLMLLHSAFLKMH